MLMVKRISEFLKIFQNYISKLIKKEKKNEKMKKYVFRLYAKFDDLINISNNVSIKEDLTKSWREIISATKNLN